MFSFLSAGSFLFFVTQCHNKLSESHCVCDWIVCLCVYVSIDMYVKLCMDIIISLPAHKHALVVFTFITWMYKQYIMTYNSTKEVYHQVEAKKSTHVKPMTDFFFKHRNTFNLVTWLTLWVLFLFFYLTPVVVRYIFQSKISLPRSVYRMVNFFFRHFHIT